MPRVDGSAGGLEVIDLHCLHRYALMGWTADGLAGRTRRRSQGLVWLKEVVFPDDSFLAYNDCE